MSGLGNMRTKLDFKHGSSIGNGRQDFESTKSDNSLSYDISSS